MEHGSSVQPIFKRYDIRAKYPDPLSPEVVYRVGWAFGIYLRQALHCRRGLVAIGRDMRHGSNELAHAAAQGLVAAGIRPANLGLVATDMLYFVCGEHPDLYDAGIMITASHNPANENGLKFVLSGARPIWAKRGLNVVRDIYLSPEEHAPAPAPLGAIEERHYTAAYIAKLFRLAPEPIAPFKVVVDAGNGMAGLIFPRLAERLPCQIVPLFFKLDGSFPNRGSDPTKPANLAKLQAAVIAEHADLGLAFDGDADRMAVLDETGRLVPGPIAGALVTAWIRQRMDDVRVILDIPSHRAAEEAIREAGACPILGPVGHPLVKQKMRDEDALLAFEFSMHSYFRSFYSCDSGMLAALTVLQMLTAAGRPLSALAEPLRARYTREDSEIPVPSDEVGLYAISRVDAAFSDQEAIRVTRYEADLRKDYRDWWFCLRPSGSEVIPRLRLSVEATAREAAAQHMAEITAIIAAACSERALHAA